MILQNVFSGIPLVKQRVHKIDSSLLRFFFRIYLIIEITTTQITYFEIVFKNMAYPFIRLVVFGTENFCWKI